MAEIKNGVLVSRMWGHLGDGELIAHFQYDGDAKKFAELLSKDERQPKDAWWIVCNTYSGEVFVYRRSDQAAGGGE